MLLSIAIMIKNEEKYLNNTLNSLMPLMKNINSELVILDTGSTDKSINIAKKYTDKVYYSEWNNNFSEMRNKSISYTKGDWILVLDADEELLDCENLIKFFNSNLHKKYNCASIKLKNIHSEDESAYSMGSILRLFKKHKGFKYEGAIHEQPIYKDPIYNDIALFKHYGYMYVNEEVKQVKLKRNEQILFKELEKNENDPYTNYQLGKNYLAFDKHQESFEYTKKAYDIYMKSGHIPIFVVSNLARLYICISKFKKCEELCLKYIKKDDKNIDIYYFLALSQANLKKYNDSIKHYERYIFLIENYDISTQANSIECNGDTLALKENAEIDIINMYYELEMYEDILKMVDSMELNQIRKVYSIVFMTLYKLNSIEKILDMYNQISDSIVEKNTFKLSLEKLLIMSKENDRKKIYKIFSKIDGNYGVLNQVRLEKELSIKELNKILKDEKESYYGDLIYYAFKQNIEIENILSDISYVYLQNYIDYIVINRKDCILELYEYLLKTANTLDINKIHIYSCLSKSLLIYGNLMDEKYENLFLMYISYNYDSLRKVYNPDFKDEELLKFVKNDEEIFIINIIMIQKLKKINKLEYVRKMKELLIENKRYKYGIEILINKFKMELNEIEELKSLKNKYKLMIENNINDGLIREAEEKISEYEDIFGLTSDSLNLKAVIEMMKSNFNESDKILKKAYLLDRNNYDVIFNIGCIKEILGQYDDAIEFLQYIVKNCNDKNIVLESKQKIRYINSI